ncbi:hypothetical protein JKP88DRAFT_227454, partial [Tribonema minus]
GSSGGGSSGGGGSGEGGSAPAAAAMEGHRASAHASSSCDAGATTAAVGVVDWRTLLLLPAAPPRLPRWWLNMDCTRTLLSATARQQHLQLNSWCGAQLSLGHAWQRRRHVPVWPESSRLAARAISPNVSLVSMGAAAPLQLVTAAKTAAVERCLEGMSAAAACCDVGDWGGMAAMARMDLEAALLQQR